MVTVGVVAGVVERRLAAGRLRCPGCRAGWRGGGMPGERVVRGGGGIGWRLRPRRSRCWGCGVTHVLLPVSCLLRRADGAAVIWAALAGKAAGLGYRPIARPLGRPASTVRGWLARFASRAGAVRGRVHGVAVRAGCGSAAAAAGGVGGGRRGGRDHRGRCGGGAPLGRAAGQPVAG